MATLRISGIVYRTLAATLLGAFLAGCDMGGGSSSENAASSGSSSSSTTDSSSSPVVLAGTTWTIDGQVAIQFTTDTRCVVPNSTGGISRGVYALSGNKVTANATTPEYNFAMEGTVAGNSMATTMRFTDKDTGVTDVKTGTLIKQ